MSERDLFAMQRLSLKNVSTPSARRPTSTRSPLARDIRRFARNLLGQGVAARQLTQLISHLNDLLTEQLVRLARSARSTCRRLLAGLRLRGRSEPRYRAACPPCSTGPILPDTWRVRLVGGMHCAAGELIHARTTQRTLWAAIGPGHARRAPVRALRPGQRDLLPADDDHQRALHPHRRQHDDRPARDAVGGHGAGPECVTDPVVHIGDRCLIGRGSGIVGHLAIDIGDDVWTGHYVYITDQNHGYDDPDRPISQQIQPERPVTIGDGSWIGHGTRRAARRHDRSARRDRRQQRRHRRDPRPLRRRRRAGAGDQVDVPAERSDEVRSRGGAHDAMSLSAANVSSFSLIGDAPRTRARRTAGSRRSRAGASVKSRRLAEVACGSRLSHCGIRSWPLASVGGTPTTSSSIARGCRSPGRRCRHAGARVRAWPAPSR